MKVWIVESGEYWQRMVIGVYSTEENAKIAAGSDSDVTEYELDQHIDRFRAGMRIFEIVMDREGNVLKAKEWGYSTVDDRVRLTSSKPLRFGRERYFLDEIEGLVWAKSQEQAIKIVNEHRAEKIASGEWDRQQQKADKDWPMREKGDSTR